MEGMRPFGRGTVPCIALLLSSRVALLLSARVALLLSSRVALLLSSRVALLLSARVSLLLSSRVVLLLSSRVALLLSSRVALSLHPGCTHSRIPHITCLACILYHHNSQTNATTRPTSQQPNIAHKRRIARYIHATAYLLTCYSFTAYINTVLEHATQLSLVSCITTSQYATIICL
jgi:hypothetical protein